MRQTNLLEREFLVILASLIFFWTLFSNLTAEPTARAELVKTKQVYPPSIGMRLRIPKIKVDAKVEEVGLASDGGMDSPKQPENVAWFNLGPRPGGIGSAIIDGHFGWKDGLPAVFDHLSELRPNDKLYIEDENKIVRIFVVRELRTYDQHDITTEVFHSNDGKAHLNLITCEGVWNKKQKSYSDRLVVFADRE